jgi:hypothetical protein
MQLEQLQPSAMIRGILPDALVEVVSVRWFGAEALELTYKTPTGKLANEILYRDDESRLELAEQGRPWSFDGDGALFRLVSEAHRIRLAHLFDPLLAVHTSLVDPLPHQVTAVYEAMLPRQPLRFLLADDPGAGKTIMAGLLIKELIARGDLQRCLIVCPGSLAEQVAGRAVAALRPALRHPRQRQARGRTHRQLVPRNPPRHRPAGQALAQRRHPAQAPSPRLPLGPGGLRRGAQALGHGVRQRGQVQVGFALTILQRRLASSPEAIDQSLRRRRERLESRLRELEVLQRGGQAAPILAASLPALDSDDVDDLDEAPENELAALEEAILDQATAARSIAELRCEIATLQHLEGQALAVCRSGTDTKWCELASLPLDTARAGAAGARLRHRPGRAGAPGRGDGAQA